MAHFQRPSSDADMAKDILVNRVNRRELVGKAAIVDDPREPLVYEALNICLRRNFSQITLTSCFERIAFVSSSKAMLSRRLEQASVGQPQVPNIMVPLTPLAEQCRIVAKVEELTSVRPAGAATDDSPRRKAAAYFTPFSIRPSEILSLLGFYPSRNAKPDRLEFFEQTLVTLKE